MPSQVVTSAITSRAARLGVASCLPSQGAEGAAGVVASPVVAAVGAEEDVLAAAVLRGAGAPLAGPGRYLLG
jgi:hypothetical protein